MSDLGQKPSKYSIKSLLKPFRKKMGTDDAKLDHGATLLKDAELITQALQLQDIPIRTLAVPRSDIVWLPATANKEQVVKIAVKHPFTRFPVCEGKLDQVKGVITSGQIMSKVLSSEAFSLEKPLQKPLFLSPSLTALKALMFMIHKNHHIALIIDEYGGIDGLLTVKDLIEEITGKIEDILEEEDAPQFQSLPDGSVQVDGRFPIDELEEALNLPLLAKDMENEIDTVAGLITHLSGTVPKVGAIIEHPNGLEFEVTSADLRKVKKVKIHVPKGEKTTKATGGNGKPL